MPHWFNVLRQHLSWQKSALCALALLLAAIVTLRLAYQPPGHAEPLATRMHAEVGTWFERQQQLGELMRDLNAGVLAEVGLTPRYALVTRKDGVRYHVAVEHYLRTVSDSVLKAAGEGQLLVANLGEAEPPVPTAVRFARAFGVELLQPLLTLALLGLIGFWLLAMLRPGAKFSKLGERPSIRFDDVVGAREAKNALADVVAHLKQPERFSTLGGIAPRGVLLQGPPGTGKTLLAKALAGECGANFIALSGSDFTDKFVGVSVGRVKALFKQARKLAPCVVFIDEIDGLGRRQSSAAGGAVEMENNRTINQLLVELDGFAANSGVIVVGATNHAQTVDAALLREGRFDRRVGLALPDLADRQALFELYTQRVKAGSDIDHRQLARLSTGLSPAAIDYAVKNAATLAAKSGHAQVGHADLIASLETVQLGEASRSTFAAMSAADRERVAVHEAGHALCAHVLGHGIVEKVTIVPRGNALGVTLITEDSDRHMKTRDELFHHMVTLMGGRNAETLELGDCSTGASQDLQQASSLAYRMVSAYGFGEKGDVFSLEGLPEEVRHGGLEHEAVAEARALVARADEACRQLLVEHRRGLTSLAQALIDRETVSAEEVRACLGEKAWRTHSTRRKSLKINSPRRLVHRGRFI